MLGFYRWIMTPFSTAALQFGILAGIAHFCAAAAHAELKAEPLADTGQINPDGLIVLGAANMRYHNQPEGLGGAVHGVEFDDVIWGEETELSTGATLEGSVAGDTRTANIGGSIDGDGADILAEIANSINFYGVDLDGTLTFGKLPENHAVVVQLITSDAASAFNNWAGSFTNWIGRNFEIRGWVHGAGGAGEGGGSIRRVGRRMLSAATTLRN